MYGGWRQMMFMELAVQYLQQFHKFRIQWLEYARDLQVEDGLTTIICTVLFLALESLLPEGLSFPFNRRVHSISHQWALQIDLYLKVRMADSTVEWTNFETFQCGPPLHQKRKRLSDENCVLVHHVDDRNWQKRRRLNDITVEYAGHNTVNATNSSQKLLQTTTVETDTDLCLCQPSSGMHMDTSYQSCQQSTRYVTLDRAYAFDWLNTRLNSHDFRHETTILTGDTQASEDTSQATQETCHSFTYDIAIACGFLTPEAFSSILVDYPQPSLDPRPRSGANYRQRSYTPLSGSTPNFRTTNKGWQRCLTVWEWKQNMPHSNNACYSENHPKHHPQKSVSDSHGKVNESIWFKKNLHKIWSWTWCTLCRFEALTFLQFIQYHDLCWIANTHCHSKMYQDISHNSSTPERTSTWAGWPIYRALQSSYQLTASIHSSSLMSPMSTSQWLDWHCLSAQLQLLHSPASQTKFDQVAYIPILIIHQQYEFSSVQLNLASLYASVCIHQNTIVLSLVQQSRYVRLVWCSSHVSDAAK